MTTPSLHELSGIIVVVEEPLWYSQRYTEFHFSKDLESYTHTISAEKGFNSCQFTIKLAIEDVDDWLEGGLARHIVVYDASTSKLWEGFVNKVIFNLGAVSMSRGPLFDITNRVTVAYTPIIDPDADPPVTGAATETTIADDTDSQARYGIIEKILNGGQRLDDGTTDEAEEVRDLYLSEHKEPFTDEDINLTALNEPTMTIECLGYWDWFSVYVHNEFTATTVTLDAKVKQVLNADPNSIFSTDQSFVEANAQLTNQYEDKNRFAATILNEIVSLGDASDNRWVIQVYEDRLVYYKSIPTTVQYKHALTSSSQDITLIDGTMIEPWRLRPAVWVEANNFLVGQTGYSTMRKDPRNIFVEQVTYTAPYGLSVTGGRVSTARQRLNQLGIGSA